MGDLLIRNGTVIDGTGAPGERADIRVRGGRIAEIGPSLESLGETNIDASGTFVTPGFIDSHTHFDAAIHWDPMCDPMPQHGVTTVLAGNCSLGFAPMKARDRKPQIDVFSYLEDLPADMLENALNWDWESFADYARAISEMKLGVNMMAFVGHAQIRSFVMGDAAWDRAATAAEVAAMAALLDEALRTGAPGMSFSLYDKDPEGRPVPSCLADDAELDALIAKLGEYGGLFQFVPADTTDAIIAHLEWLGGFLGRHGVTGLYNTLVHLDSDPQRSHRLVACLEDLAARGITILGMVSPRHMEMEIGFERSMALIAVPAWNELIQAPAGHKRQMIDDPDWRDRARRDVDAHVSVLFPFDKPELLVVNSVGKPEFQPWFGRTLADIAGEHGGHVSDALADWVRDNAFSATFTFAIANTSSDDVARLLKSPVALVSASDAGAHLQMFCAAGDSTLLLTRYVRDRGDLSLEDAVHALTGKQAGLLGLPDRGVLAPGAAADIVIFALDELSYGQQRPVQDLPGGYTRLTRDPGGYRYTIVNGEVVQAGGKATGALPARWLARTG